MSSSCDLKTTATRFFAEYAVPVVPLHDHKKGPRKTWSELRDRPEACLDWWEEPGSVTGAWLAAGQLPKGYVALDCDVAYEHRDRVLDWLGLSESVTEARSASGNFHLFLRAPRKLNLRIKTEIPEEVLEGATGKVEVRSGSYQAGLVMVGSSVRNKNGDRGSYTSDSAEEIWSLDWSEVTTHEAQALEERLGPSEQPREEAEGDGSAISALLHAHINPIMPLYQGGIDLANDWATAHGNLLGRLVRSERVAPKVLAKEAWAAILAAADTKTRSDLTNSPRHEKSFLRNFERGIAEAREDQRRAVEAQLRVHLGGADVEEAGARVAAASMALFGGGIWVTTTMRAGADPTYRVSVLKREHMADEGPLLSDVDVDHPSATHVTLENGFRSVGGVSWITHLAQRLNIPPDRVHAFRESKVSTDNLKDWMVLRGTVDAGEVDFGAYRLTDLIENFNRENYEAKVANLSGAERSRHAWTLAPRVGQRQVGAEPFLVVHADKVCLALTPLARRRYDTAVLWSVTGGRPPDYKQSGPNRQEVHLYDVEDLLHADE